MKAVKLNKTQKVLNYVAKHPDAKASAVSKATGVTVSYVYLVMSKAKSKAKAESDLAYRVSQGRTPMRMKTVATFISDTPLAGKLRTAADNVNHPSHYKTGGIETIDFIEAKGLGYHLGNVVKYITRADHKGNRKEDLLKAQWYLNRAIAKL